MKQFQSEYFESADKIPSHEREMTKESGGISMKTQTDEGFLKVLAAFIKKIGTKVIKGKFNFSTMQRPSILCNPQSHLMVIADDFLYIIKYVYLACELKDPVQRLQMISTGIIANLSYGAFNAKGKGPLNSFLGETHSATMQDGTKIYLEQISLEPHSSLVYIKSIQNKFSISAKVVFDIKIGMDLSAVCENSGYYTIQLKDGTVYEYNMPEAKINGTLSKTPTFHYRNTFSVNDTSNNIIAKIDLKYESTKGIKNLFSKKSDESPNQFTAVIQKTSLIVLNLSEGFGNWTRYVVWDNKILFKVNDEVGSWLNDKTNLAFSSVNRKELELIKLQKFDEADKLIEAMELREDKERKSRKEYKLNKKQKRQNQNYLNYFLVL